MAREKVKALLQESLSIAAKTGAVKPSELSEVIVDTTVQPKNVMFPTDARLLNRAREILARLSRMKLRQSYARVGQFPYQANIYVKPRKQFKRANRALKKLKTYLGRVIRDVDRQIEGDVLLKEMVFAHILSLARRVRDQKQHQRGPKVYSLHAPEVECIGRGVSAQALRVRRQDLGRNDASPCQGRPIRNPCQIAAGQSLRWPHPGESDPRHGSARPAERFRVSSPTRVIATTMRRPITSSGSSSQARSGASPQRSSARCDDAPPSSPSSAISNPSIGWASTISAIARVMPSMPSSPPPDTTSASSSAG